MNDDGTVDGDIVLEAEDVTHSFGDVNVLDGLSMSLRSGEVCALVGANGSGKTTLLRVLAGLLPPDAGEVRTEAEDDARTVGYLPQKPVFRSGFTAAETLRFYTRLLRTGTPERYVEDALETVGLLDARDRNVSGLSGGMTRLLGVAQAKVGDPPIMMLDEPTSGLDPNMTGRVFRTVRDIADDGAAVLLATHDLERIGRDADRLLILHEGVVAESGPPADIVERYDADGLPDVFDRIVEGGQT